MAAILLCIAAFILLLPHNQAATGKNGQQSGNLSRVINGTTSTVPITNITNPVTTIAPTTTAGQGFSSTTTVTSSGSNSSTTTQPFNNSKYLQQISNSSGYSTTTILYVYCVGSPLPNFNQSYYAPLGSSGVGQWRHTTSYPIPFSEGSCASNGADVYCLSDSSSASNATGQTYFANVTPKGIGPWKSATSYPIPFSLGSCTTYNNFIYCVGTNSGTNLKGVYYTQTSINGVGTWSQTTSYPVPFYGAQCNAYNGYIYCIGDTYFNASALRAFYSNITNIPNTWAEANQITQNGVLPHINYDYYAPISASGVGQWKQITPTPQQVNGGSCTISNSTIYCIGGSATTVNAANFTQNTTFYNSSVNIPGFSSQFGNDTSAAFFAHIGANGQVGNWSYTTPYLNQLQNTQCASGNGNIYCIGGSGQNASQETFYSSISPRFGISNWLRTTDYPIPFYSGYCSTSA
jgi:hypothetical protein